MPKAKKNAVKRVAKKGPTSKRAKVQKMEVSNEVVEEISTDTMSELEHDDEPKW